MAGPSFSCGRLTSGRTEDPIPITPSSCLLQPTSFPSVLTATRYFCPSWWWGVCGWTISSTPTSASTVLPVSAAATSAAKSGSVLGLQVYISAPVPGSTGGCLCSNAIKIPLFIHRLPGSPNKPDHEFPRVSSQRRVRARAGPVTLSLRDVTEADLPTIAPHGGQTARH